MNHRILVVDDESRMAQVVAAALERAGHECEICANGDQALAALERRGADAVVSDIRMPGLDGMQLLHRISERWPELPVIFLTAYGSVASAVAAIRAGAFDYITKPFDNDELRALVGRALELRRLNRENRYLRQQLGERYAPDEIVASSPKMLQIFELVKRVAPGKPTVLIQGESGTGKELIARLLHFWSDRVGQPLVAINCTAFAEGVLESELFGHEKGAFTGAVQTRAGCFERAAGGTLFLDEIGEVSPEFQAKLLRVLQDGEVLRVGGSEPRRVDVRVVAATNRNLREEVAAGRFREDLYFRLNVIPISLPPLRERGEEILPLAQKFLLRHGADSKRNLKLGAEAQAALLAHGWRGNVRELENAIERAVMLCRGDTITPEDLLLEQPLGGREQPASATLQEHLDAAAAAGIRAALAAASGQKAEAARVLGIDRTTLYRMMKRFGLE